MRIHVCDGHVKMRGNGRTGPHQHLAGREQKEQVTGHGLRENGKGQPRQALPKVIGASHETKHIAMWDFADLGSSGTQVHENDVAVQVVQLSKLGREIDSHDDFHRCAHRRARDKGNSNVTCSEHE